MRAILIDPKAKTLSEIQITDHDAEHSAIMQCGDFYVFPLSYDETGYNAILYNNRRFDTGIPGFVLERVWELSGKLEKDLFYDRGRALVVRRDRSGEDETTVLGDLQMNVKELKKLITFIAVEN